MTPTDEIQDHQARCQPHLLRLRMMARSEAEALPSQVVTEVVQAMGAILAEAEAAGRDVGSTAVAGRGGPGTGTFWLVRLNRLAAAADDAITAARAGNLAEMRRHLARFEALTSAIWTVQRAVYGQGGALGPPVRSWPAEVGDCGKCLSARGKRSNSPAVRPAARRASLIWPEDSSAFTWVRHPGSGRPTRCSPRASAGEGVARTWSAG